VLYRPVSGGGSLTVLVVMLLRDTQSSSQVSVLRDLKGPFGPCAAPSGPSGAAANGLAGFGKLLPQPVALE